MVLAASEHTTRTERHRHPETANPYCHLRKLRHSLAVAQFCQAS